MKFKNELFIFYRYFYLESLLINGWTIKWTRTPISNANVFVFATKDFRRSLFKTRNDASWGSRPFNSERAKLLFCARYCYKNTELESRAFWMLIKRWGEGPCPSVIHVVTTAPSLNSFSASLPTHKLSCS